MVIIYYERSGAQDVPFGAVLILIATIFFFLFVVPLETSCHNMSSRARPPSSETRRSVGRCIYSGGNDLEASLGLRVYIEMGAVLMAFPRPPWAA